MAKIQNFDKQFWGLYSHISAPINVPRAKFHVYRGNVSPLWGEKPIFGPLNKNNTGMAALRADLLVINWKWLQIIEPTHIWGLFALKRHFLDSDNFLRLCIPCLPSATVSTHYAKPYTLLLCIFHMNTHTHIHTHRQCCVSLLSERQLHWTFAAVPRLLGSAFCL